MCSYPQKPVRARDIGLPFEGVTGRWNAITDVEGVTVGHETIISDDDPDHVDTRTIRTGITAILPRGKTYNPVFAGCYSLNGNGEMTGTTWIEESGFLEGPILFTNTHSVGLVRDTVIKWQVENNLSDPIAPGIFWLLPVVGETYDGVLNDINGQHIKEDHVYRALESASTGPVLEGCVGGGTGMICHEFKGGIGTASRKVTVGHREYTLGVLVQANHGIREDLTIAGVPVGRLLKDMPSPKSSRDAASKGAGSILVAVATDAPLLPHQLKRIARRVPLGISRVGSHGEQYSGDIFIAFSTANSKTAGRKGISNLEMLPNDQMDPLFHATVQATEEAILNALIAAKTTNGRNGKTAYALPHDKIIDIIRSYRPLLQGNDERKIL